MQKETCRDCNTRTETERKWCKERLYKRAKVMLVRSKKDKKA